MLLSQALDFEKVTAKNTNFKLAFSLKRFQKELLALLQRGGVELLSFVSKNYLLCQPGKFKLPREVR